MKTFTKEELDTIITNHKKWLNDENDGIRANLRDANLQNADLRDANLRCADLPGANLRSADLRCADLQGADLRCADLRDANLRCADLRNANLRDAIINETNLGIIQTIITPEGDLIGWKKTSDSVIIKLLIPKEAKRSNATSRKCRAEFVKVLEIIGADKAVSNYNPSTIYKVGEIINADSWDANRFNECSHGIHFFLTREEAEAY